MGPPRAATVLRVPGVGWVAMPFYQEAKQLHAGGDTGRDLPLRATQPPGPDLSGGVGGCPRSQLSECPGRESQTSQAPRSPEPQQLCHQTGVLMAFPCGPVLHGQFPGLSVGGGIRPWPGVGAVQGVGTRTLHSALRASGAHPGHRDQLQSLPWVQASHVPSP